MKTTYHAIIAGGTHEFRNHLKNILKMVEKEANNFFLETIDAFSMDELESELDVHSDLVFVDSDFAIRQAGRLARLWKKTKSDCEFALLLSERNAAELKTAIEEMEKQKSLPTEIHILKNNYPDELIMRVILRMVEYGVAQKNLAVV